jgi:hypothetical protein
MSFLALNKTFLKPIALEGATIQAQILLNVWAYLKWLGKGCAKCEDASEVGDYNPVASTRSM